MQYRNLFTLVFICVSSSLFCSDNNKSKELKKIIDAERVNGKLTHYHQKEQALAKFVNEQQKKRKQKKVEQQVIQTRYALLLIMKLSLLNESMLFWDETYPQRNKFSAKL